MFEINWNGHVIEVIFRLFPSACWIGGGFIVRIDGATEFRPPMVYEPGGTATQFEIAHHNKTVQGVVRSVGRVMAIGTAFELEVDKATIATGTLRAENWFVLYAVIAALLVVAVCLFVCLACMKTR